jgi:hypothetical protein
MHVHLRRTVLAAAVVSVAAAAGATTAMSANAAATGCRVSYAISSQWQGGFGANVSVTNLGDPINQWTVTWSFGAGQQVTQAWNTALTQSGSQVSARNVSYNGSLATNASTAFGFNGSWTGTNPVPTTFSLNGVTCTGGAQPTTPPPSSPPPSSPPPSSPPPSSPPPSSPPPSSPPPSSPPPSSPPPSSPPPSSPPPSSAARSMGFIGCSMAENVAQGYVAVGGQRMWGPYGTGGMVVQSWTDTNSASWRLFDQQAGRNGRPTAVWVQICIFANPGATYNEVKQLIANARQHAAAGATIYISGQPLYDAGQTCTLAGANGPQLTDNLAKQAGADTTQNVRYVGQFRLHNGEVADGCHANTTGQASLGRQAVAFWG